MKKPVKTPESKRVSEAIKIAVIKKGVMVSDLYTIAHLSHESYRTRMLDPGDFRLSELDRIAKYLDINLLDLIAIYKGQKNYELQWEKGNEYAQT